MYCINLGWAWRTKNQKPRNHGSVQQIDKSFSWSRLWALLSL